MLFGRSPAASEAQESVAACSQPVAVDTPDTLGSASPSPSPYEAIAMRSKSPVWWEKWRGLLTLSVQLPSVTLWPLKSNQNPKHQTLDFLQRGNSVLQRHPIARSASLQRFSFYQFYSRGLTFHFDYWAMTQPHLMPKTFHFISLCLLINRQQTTKWKHSTVLPHSCWNLFCLCIFLSQKVHQVCGNTMDWCSLNFVWDMYNRRTFCRYASGVFANTCFAEELGPLFKFTVN